MTTPKRRTPQGGHRGIQPGDTVVNTQDPTGYQAVVVDFHPHHTVVEVMLLDEKEQPTYTEWAVSDVRII